MKFVTLSNNYNARINVANLVEYHPWDVTYANAPENNVYFIVVTHTGSESPLMFAYYSDKKSRDSDMLFLDTVSQTRDL